MDRYARFLESICWISFAGLAGALDLWIATKWAIIISAIAVGVLNISLCR